MQVCYHIHEHQAKKCTQRLIKCHDFFHRKQIARYEIFINKILQICFGAHLISSNRDLAATGTKYMWCRKFLENCKSFRNNLWHKLKLPTPWWRKWAYNELYVIAIFLCFQNLFKFYIPSCSHTESVDQNLVIHS